jgi:SAM-dependent methyltransferase
MSLEPDFGKTAGDYAKFRAGFPPALFERLASMGVGLPGHRVLDLGTGTGTLARGFARRGATVTGLDKSDALLEQAKHLDRDARVSVTYRVATAEDTGLPADSFDVVTAGQCWHWFDRHAAASEARRLLVPNGRLVIAHFDWIPIPGNVAYATEKLIEHHNPDWKFGGGIGVHPAWFRDVAIAGFADLESFSFDEETPYSHEAWRGRIRASAGIAASMPPDKVAKFDHELRDMLAEHFPQDPFTVLHRIFALICRNPE